MAENSAQRQSRLQGMPAPFDSTPSPVAANEISIGSGAPSKPNGVNPVAGDVWHRTDTPGTANQRIYVCTVGGASPTWVGIA